MRCSALLLLVVVLASQVARRRHAPEIPSRARARSGGSDDGGGSAPRPVRVLGRLDARTQRGDAERGARRAVHRGEAASAPGSRRRGTAAGICSACRSRARSCVRRSSPSSSPSRARAPRSIRLASRFRCRRSAKGCRCRCSRRQGDLVFAGYGLSIARVRAERSGGAVARGQGGGVRERCAARTRLRAQRPRCAIRARSAIDSVPSLNAGPRRSSCSSPGRQANELPALAAGLTDSSLRLQPALDGPRVLPMVLFGSAQGRRSAAARGWPRNDRSARARRPLVQRERWISCRMAWRRTTSSRRSRLRLGARAHVRCVRRASRSHWHSTGGARRLDRERRGR